LAWAIDCEARHLLALPLRKRREALEARERVRGREQVQALKDAMTRIHAQRRAAKSDTKKWT
jgi:hypothetical protein